MTRLAVVVGVMSVLACGTPSTKPNDAGAAAPSASASQFDFSCDHAVLAWDEGRAPTNASAACRVHVATQSGAPVSGASVRFLTEAGWFDEATTDLNGTVTAAHHVGEGAPAITTPDGGTVLPGWFVLSQRTADGGTSEPGRVDPLHQVAGPMNPRDNLVSLVAMVRGDEAFDDRNGDGRWDDGEAFEDLGEPWLDTDDNGVHDEGEPFIDVDGDGVWTAGDGKWSHDALIWKQTAVVWLGAINPLDVTSAAPPVDSVPRTVKLRCPAALPPGSLDCAAAVAESGEVPFPVEVRLVDPWLNAWSLLGPATCSVATTSHLTASLDGWLDATHLRVRVADARDPNTPPITQVPKRAYVLDELVTVNCSFGAQTITTSIPVTID